MSISEGHKPQVDIVACVDALGWSMRSLAQQIGVDPTIIQRTADGVASLRPKEIGWLHDRVRHALRTPPPQVEQIILPRDKGEPLQDLAAAFSWLFWSARGFAATISVSPKDVDKVLAGRAKLAPETWAWLQGMVLHAQENPAPHRHHKWQAQRASKPVRRTRQKLVAKAA